MADVKRMVTGFNHNIKHRGKAYHIQTEDSGLGNPHITTHLFVGGNILASKNTGYADIVGAENLAQVVRELMEEQHKEMLRNLVNGVYDDVDAALAAQARAYQPGQLATVDPPAPPPVRAPPRPAAPLAPAPRPLAAAPSPVAAAPRPVAGAPRPLASAPRPAPAPPPLGARAQPPPLRPPPPRPAARPLPPEVVAARAAPPPVEKNDGIETLFGEDLISEKSLDEVILSYLAEDLGDKKP
jgi:hypothetical protein